MAESRSPARGSRESQGDPVAEALAGALERVAGAPPWAILLFGSRLVGTTPGRQSAYDLIVVVDAYAPFYQRLREHGLSSRRPWLMTALAHILPPNVIALDPGLPGGEIAKVMVLTPQDLEKALSQGARDHFLRGRLVQSTMILRARPDAWPRLEALLAGARQDVLRWTAPWLPESFEAQSLALRMLEVSYAAEVRPEAPGRVCAVFDAQRDFLQREYQRVLEEGERAGTVTRAGSRWRLSAPPGRVARVRSRLYFLRSKARATARWLKHIVTFDDWLAYIQGKVERRTGLRVEVTPLERRFPLVLLWPKVIRVLGELRRTRLAEASRVREARLTPGAPVRQQERQ